MQRTRVSHGDKSVRLREIRRKRRQRLVYAGIFAAVMAVAAAAWHTHTAERRIDGVTVRGAYLVDEAVARAAVEGVLDGTTLFIFSNRYPWLAPISRARRAIEAVPAVASAHVRVADDALEVTVTERIPVAIGCSPACTLVDVRGVGIGDPSRATSTLPRILVADSVSRPFDRAVPEEMLTAALSFLSKLNAQGFAYTDVSVIDADQIEVRGAGLPMLKAAFETLDAAPTRLAIVTSSGSLSHSMSEAAYVDLRFERSVAFMPVSSANAAHITPTTQTASTTDAN